MQRKHVVHPGGHAQQDAAQDADVVEVLAVDRRLPIGAQRQLVLVQRRVVILIATGTRPGFICCRSAGSRRGLQLASPMTAGLP